MRILQIPSTPAIALASLWRVSDSPQTAFKIQREAMRQLFLNFGQKKAKISFKFIKGQFGMVYVSAKKCQEHRTICAVDLFAGAGGFSQAARDCQCALQRDPPCARKSDPPLGVMCKDTKWGFNEGGKRGVA